VKLGSYPDGHWLNHTCVMGTCLAHRRGTYWNPQERQWVHADGWPCEDLAGQPEPWSARPILERTQHDGMEHHPAR
jgi:hypothetical protein